MRPLLMYSKYAFYLQNFGNTKKIQNILLNRYERSKRKLTLKSSPFKITIDPGNFCNLRCPGCHTGIKHAEMIKPCFMKFENYKTIFNQFKDTAISVALYNWGEPFLNKQLFSMIDYTRQNKVGSTIHSNFNVFTEQMAIDAVKSGLTHIYLSIDGASQEAYQKYRVNGHLDNVMANLKIMLDTKKRMNSKYPLITWKFLTFDHNIHEVEAARKMAMELGVDAFETFTANPHLMDIYDEAQGYKEQPEKLKSLNPICNSLWSSVYVNSDGSILPCSLAFREYEKFGNLFDNPFKEIWNNDKFVGARKMFSTTLNENEIPLPCRACKYALLCNSNRVNTV